MPDLLEQSSAWLEDQREQHLSRKVIYQRGSESIEIVATIGRTIFNVDSGDGASLRVVSRDYLIRAAHLILGGSIVLPQRGDQIHELDPATGSIFIHEVLAPGGEPEWRYSDPYRKTLRIHTKEVDKEMLP